MNEGQFQALWSELKRMNGQLDEIRRAANRIDGRLKEAQDTPFFDGKLFWTESDDGEWVASTIPPLEESSD